VLVVVGWFETGKPLFIQQRVGRYGKPFKLLKFRTMKVGTASVASHDIDPSVITPVGKFLRKTKLDELPQLINVLKGDMSLVGPRPCLTVQKDLIKLREQAGVFSARPGITGRAQIKNIDMSRPVELVCEEVIMLQSLKLKQYFFYLFMTLTGSGSGDAVQ
jgi:lipopolysaccharide/colanic/teichoic acid biosynthesis glycosyltransferase